MDRIWNLEQYAEKTALIDEFGNRLTYGELDSESRRLAEQVGKRCLVFCLCRNEIGSVLGYVSFINNGIVPIMINSHLEENLLQNLYTTYQPSYIWLPKEQRGQYSALKQIYEAYEYCLL